MSFGATEAIALEFSLAEWGLPGSLSISPAVGLEILLLWQTLGLLVLSGHEPLIEIVVALLVSGLRLDLFFNDGPRHSNARPILTDTTSDFLSDPNILNRRNNLWPHVDVEPPTRHHNPWTARRAFRPTARHNDRTNRTAKRTEIGHDSRRPEK